jgi:hypothetical protein
MLLLEPLFVCLVGIGVAVLVTISAPAWTAAAARLNEWFLHSLRQASHTVDSSLNTYDENVVEGQVVDHPAKNQNDGSSGEQTPESNKEST